MNQWTMELIMLSLRFESDVSPQSQIRKASEITDISVFSLGNYRNLQLSYSTIYFPMQ